MQQIRSVGQFIDLAAGGTFESVRLGSPLDSFFHWFQFPSRHNITPKQHCHSIVVQTSQAPPFNSIQKKQPSTTTMMVMVIWSNQNQVHLLAFTPTHPLRPLHQDLVPSLKFHWQFHHKSLNSSWRPPPYRLYSNSNQPLLSSLVHFRSWRAINPHIPTRSHYPGYSLPIHFLLHPRTHPACHLCLQRTILRYHCIRRYWCSMIVHLS